MIKRIVFAGMLSLLVLDVSAQQAKPTLWDKVKQKVQENVSINGVPQAAPAGRVSGPRATSSKSDLMRRFWGEPDYTPSIRNGAAHLRIGNSGVDQFNNGVDGEHTCDLDYLIAGKTGIPMTPADFDRCAMIEFWLAKQNGKEPAINANTGAGKFMALEKYRPIAKARIEYLAKQDRFWFRPDLPFTEKRYIPEKGALQLQFDFPPFGGGYQGPEWGTVRWDTVARRYRDAGIITATVYTVALKMDPMEAQWFESSFSGPESEAYFTVKKVWFQSLGSGAARVPLMEVDVTRIDLAMRQTYNFNPARHLVFGSED